MRILNYCIGKIKKLRGLLTGIDFIKGRGAFFLVGMIILFLLIGGEKNLVKKMREEASTIRQECSTEDVLSSQQYIIQGDTYHRDGDDPQIIFENKLSVVDRVKITFEEAMESDVLCQIFYCKEGEGWSEENRAEEYILHGEDELELDIQRGQYEKIRIDINGDFILDSIQFIGTVKKDISIWYYVAIIAMDALLILFWSCSLVTKNRFYHIAMEAGNRVRKQYIFINRKIYSLGQRNTVRIEKVFLVLGLVLGVIYAVLVPPEQMPDEHRHVSYMRESVGFGKLMDVEVINYYKKINSSYATVFDSNHRLAKDVFLSQMKLEFSSEARTIKKLPSVQAVRYLPAAIGFAICVFFNLPIYFCLQIAEICSVIFYAIIGYFALKRIPILKGALFTVMLLPMTLQQCASVSHDVVLLVGTFWVFSYLVYCIAEKEKVGWRDVFILLLWCMVIVPIKPPYIFLFFLFFAIPKEKVALPVKKVGNLYTYICRYWYVMAGMAIFVACLLLPYTQYNYLMETVLLDFRHTIEVYKETLSNYSQFYLVSMVGDFGWLVHPMPMNFVWMSYILMILVALCSAVELKKGMAGRIWSVAIVVLCVLLICLSMVAWTFYIEKIDCGTTLESFRSAYAKIKYFLGVQGRYFIPLVPLLMYAIHGVIKVNKKNHVGLMIVVYGIWFIWPIVSIESMFWG